MKDPNDYNVRAVERALLILNCFDDEHPERGISEISQEVDLHKSTTHRIVTTLVNYGFLERNGDGQLYRLGLQTAALGVRVLRRMDVRTEALPFMGELVNRWDETCDLSLFEQGQVFYLEVLQGQHALTIAANVGRRLPAHCTASGKLFLAHLSEKELASFFQNPLDQYTENTILDPETLKEELVLIRQQGYSVDNQEMEVGISAVAAPIHDLSGEVVAAMSIPGPTNRMAPERLEEIAQSLLEAADQISRRLGWKI